MPYCADADLLIGDTTVDTAIQDRFVASAADEMDSVIGQMYTVPIVQAQVEPHVWLILKRCNALLATGRLLMAQMTGSEEKVKDSYGASLVQEAKDILNKILSGQIILIGGTRGGDGAGTDPVIQNYDATSAVDAFYGFTGRRYGLPLTPFTWKPGS